MAERLFQVGIKALITNADNKILLLSMERKDGSISWDMPGGRMDSDETFLDTLKRELHEELAVGYVGEPEYFETALANVTIPGLDNVGLILITYKTQIPPTAEISLNDYETGYEWFSPQEAADHISWKYPATFVEKITLL